MKKKPGQIVKAAGILLMIPGRRPKKFLLMRHPDRWDLPKGHCEKGESFQETALRETAEETGIAADQIQLDPEFCFELSYPVTYHDFGDTVFQKQVRYFLGYLESEPELNLTEHQGSAWMDWQPPHSIQLETIDPLLAAVAKHLDAVSS